VCFLPSTRPREFIWLEYWASIVRFAHDPPALTIRFLDAHGFESRIGFEIKNLLMALAVSATTVL